jgi:lysophospholipase L1-like esterase
MPFLKAKSSLALLLTAIVLFGKSAPCTLAQRPNSASHWVATWTTAHGSTSNNVFGSPYKGTNAYSNQTLRLIAHTSIPGSAVRIRLSNAFGPQVFGTQAITVGAAHVAFRDGQTANIVPGTDRVLTFRRKPSISMVNGVDVLSDPILFPVPQTGDLVISLYLPGNQTIDTAHGEAHQTNYVSPAGGGDASGAVVFPLDSSAPTTTQWPLLAGVEVYAPTSTFAITTFGDSITDGTGEATDSNHRWPDFLAQRFFANGQSVGIANKGIGGNRVLHDIAGPSGLARFERDVLASPSGTKYVTVLLGINDIGLAALNPTDMPTANQIIAGHRQFITRAHEMGLKIYGCTLTPAGYAVGSANEMIRSAINDFIRTPGNYDGLIDFDAVTRDPNNPTLFQTQYDSGDHLHPNDAGYQAMANSIDLLLFQ